jgi:hypothetical protein
VRAGERRRRRLVRWKRGAGWNVNRRAVAPVSRSSTLVGAQASQAGPGRDEGPALLPFRSVRARLGVGGHARVPLNALCWKTAETCGGKGSRQRGAQLGSPFQSSSRSNSLPIVQRTDCYSRSRPALSRPRNKVCLMYHTLPSVACVTCPPACMAAAEW